MRTREEVYTDKVREYFKNHFDDEKRLERVVKDYLSMNEEIQCIYEAMDEYVNEAIDAAAENAEVDIFGEFTAFVNKQSILKLKK